MKAKEARETLQEAVKNPKLVSSNKYIDARLSYPDLYAVVFQVGPKCNLSCAHCYGSYGPDREGVPKIPVVKRVLQQSLELGMSHLTLTDGEPMMPENIGLMKLVSESSDRFPAQIITNGKFAENIESARDWMSFLKESGFDLRSRGNMIRVSAGQTYNISSETYANLVKAASEVYGGISFDNHLGFYFLEIDQPKKDRKCLVNLMKAVDSVLAPKTESVLKVVKDDRNERTRVYAYYPVKGKKGFVPFITMKCVSEGRAQGIPSVVDTNPSMPVDVEGIGFNPNRDMSLCVDYKGNVGFGIAQASLFGKGVYGNIMSEKLLEIMTNIFRDPIYQANHLGGVRFLYHLAQEENPQFRISAVQYLDFSQSLFEKRELIESVRKKIRKMKLIPAYKDYLRQRGIPKLG